MTTIAIVEDDEGLRRALVALLAAHAREVLAYETGEAFLEALQSHSVDLAVLDLRLPGLTGLKVLERLQPVRFPVVMTSANGDIRAAVDAIKLGAVDFIEKPFTPNELEDLVDRVLQEQKAGSPVGSPEPERACLSSLTPREREVAIALADGLTNKQVAQRLGCSPRTIEVHRARVFSKLSVSNIAALVRTVSGIGS